MRSQGVLAVALSLVFIAVARPDARAQTSAPAASPAATATPETYNYTIMQRHKPDADAQVFVTRAADRMIIRAKSTYNRAVSGLPDHNGRPTLQYLIVTTNSALTLLPSLDPLAYLNTRHVDGPANYYVVRFDAGAAKATVPQGVRDIALEAGTKHFIVRDGTDLAVLFALPLQMNAWHDDHITGVVIQRNTRGGSYAFTSSSPEIRPKGVPPADLSLQFSGIDHVTEWVDPATMIPDRIDIPEEETTIVRAGISH
jgi:hypothetical protein